MTNLGAASAAKPSGGCRVLGDLVATCSSAQSCNRRVGEQIGAGKAVREFVASMDQVTEGVKAAGVMRELADLNGVDKTIARSGRRNQPHLRRHGLLRIDHGHAKP
jgi:glycerol-3-phosphate dehydrogenase (NAD(P)+)